MKWEQIQIGKTYLVGIPDVLGPVGRVVYFLVKVHKKENEVKVIDGSYYCVNGMTLRQSTQEMCPAAGHYQEISHWPDFQENEWIGEAPNLSPEN